MRGILVFIFCLIGEGSQAVTLEFLGEQVLEHKMKFKDSVLGGLSGIAFDGKNSLFAVSDDRGSVNEPRFYKFHVEVKDKSLRVTPQEVYFLKDAQGKSFVQKVLDLEGIALLSEGGFAVVSEGDYHKRPPLQTEILLLGPTGQFKSKIDLPAHYTSQLSGKPSQGPRNNMALEGLSMSPSQKYLFAAMEGPLWQDDGPFNFEQGALLRLLQFHKEGASWRLAREFVYRSDPAPKKSFSSVIIGGGISEILALSDDELLVLERWATLDAGVITNTIRLYLVNLTQATDIRQISSLNEQKQVSKYVLPKTKVLDFDDIIPKLTSPGELDNFEGLSFGPTVDGQQTLIAVSDDNFNKGQRTLWLYFKIKK